MNSNTTEDNREL